MDDLKQILQLVQDEQVSLHDVLRTPYVGAINSSTETAQNQQSQQSDSDLSDIVDDTVTTRGRRGGVRSAPLSNTRRRYMRYGPDASSKRAKPSARRKPFRRVGKS
uniref:Polynucleotide 5'-hydroxyl-kinase grc3 n=1 Tax=Lygus hesperus TaxID=30085 RepID=A0A0A9YJN1_LYGHE